MQWTNGGKKHMKSGGRPVLVQKFKGSKTEKNVQK